MKIAELLRRGRFLFSCEFFPPKTEEGMEQLFDAVRELKKFDPGFVSVTYGAGGSTREKTIEIVSRVHNEIGLETMAHLTCVGHSRGELGSVLERIRRAGIENVIALRGDPPRGEADFRPHADGFAHAVDLVRFIKSGFDFCVAVAGYPEGHVESPDRETDWRRLEEKVRSGGELILTQLFFDNRDFFAFEKRMREKGVGVPIVPGIMPVTNFNQIVKFSRMCGARIPEAVVRDLEKIRDDSEAVHRYGVDYAVRQSEELIDRGVPALHFYTLNKSDSTRRILERLSGKIKERRLRDEKK